MSLAESKRVGERAEATAIELLPIKFVGDTTAEHYDAVVTESTDRLDHGDPIEIKSAAVVISGERPGMWFLRRRQHEQLCEDDGWYLLVVCSPDPDRRILAHRFLDAEAVEERLIPSWWSGPDSRSDFRQVRWTHVFDEGDLDAGGIR